MDDLTTMLRDLVSETSRRVAMINDQRLREAVESGRDWYLHIRPDLKESVSTIIRDDDGTVVAFTTEVSGASPRTEPLSVKERALALAEFRARRSGRLSFDDRVAEGAAALSDADLRSMFDFGLIESRNLPRFRCTLVDLNQYNRNERGRPAESGASLSRADGFRDLCFEMLELVANGGPATSTQICEWQDEIAALDGEAEHPPGSAVERAARLARQACVHALALDIQGDLELYGHDAAALRKAIQRDLDRAINEVGEDG